MPVTMDIVSTCRPMLALYNALRGKLYTRVVLDKGEF